MTTLKNRDDLVAATIKKNIYIYIYIRTRT
jgi:hypothetical protein